MIALLVGTVLALAALTFVLYPLFVPPRVVTAAPRQVRGSEPSPRQLAVEALREIEFDRETGKLSDSDYAELKASYTQRAVEAMRAESADAAPADDVLEALIREQRAHVVACRGCGPRPEPDAVYCSSCGRYLAGQCEHCGAGVDEPGARFCASCGHTLAA